MKRITLEQAVKEMQAPDWTGKTIWAQVGTSEVNIYRGLNMQTFERTGICIDIVSYNEIEHMAAVSFIEKVETGLVIYNNSAKMDSDGQVIFYNLNASQDEMIA